MVRRVVCITGSKPGYLIQCIEEVLSGVLANYNGIYFISTSHTADYVEIAAWGPGSDQ